MSIAGRINIENFEVSTATNVARYRKLTNFFVNVHDFLSSTCAPLGVVRRAAYFGTPWIHGRDPGFWDSGTPIADDTAGGGAYALFEFTKGNPPFWLLVMWDRGSNSSQNFLIDGFTSGDAVAIQFALRSDGLSPWNGTTGNSGSDSPGFPNPIWISGSSSTRLYVWPRANNPGGSYNTTKSNFVGIYKATDINLDFIFDTTSDWINMFATEESFCTVYEQAQTMVCNWSYFGKYVPIEGLNPEAPYYQWAYQGQSSNISLVANPDDFWTDLAAGDVGTHEVGSYSGFLFELTTSDGLPTYRHGGGGIGAANTGSFSNVLKFVVGTNHLPGGFSFVGPNLGVGSDSRIFDALPFHFFANETPHNTGTLGYIGTSGDLRWMYYPDHGAVSKDGTKISLRTHPRTTRGSQTAPNCDYANPSMVFPWTGSIKPFVSTRREGYDFVVT